MVWRVFYLILLILLNKWTFFRVKWIIRGRTSLIENRVRNCTVQKSRLLTFWSIVHWWRIFDYYLGMRITLYYWRRRIKRTFMIETRKRPLIHGALRKGVMTVLGWRDRWAIILKIIDFRRIHPNFFPILNVWGVDKLRDRAGLWVKMWILSGINMPIL